VERDPEMKQTQQQDRTSTPTRPLVLSVIALAFLIAFALIVARSVLPRTESVLPSGRTGNGMCDHKTSSLWRIRADGTGLIQVVTSTIDLWQPVWSPDGKWLAYILDYRAWVLDADSELTKAVSGEYTAAWIRWLPDGRLQVDAKGEAGQLINLDTGKDTKMADRYLAWSPDGTRATYLASVQIDARGDIFDDIWVDDASSGNSQYIARGRDPVRSPDSKQLAFGVRSSRLVWIWRGFCASSPNRAHGEWHGENTSAY